MSALRTARHSDTVQVNAPSPFLTNRTMSSAGRQALAPSPRCLHAHRSPPESATSYGELQADQWQELSVSHALPGPLAESPRQPPPIKLCWHVSSPDPDGPALAPDPAAGAGAGPAAASPAGSPAAARAAAAAASARARSCSNSACGTPQDGFEMKTRASQVHWTRGLSKG